MTGAEKPPRPARRLSASPWIARGAFVAALGPLLWLGVRFLRGGLGADPVAESLQSLGRGAVWLLFASLLCTPLQIVAGWNWPLRLRRMLGLFAFFYASAHLLTYVVLDQGFDLPAIVQDVLKHRFIALGMGAWLILLALAITSTLGWVRRLTFKRWKRLHRLVYVAAIGAVVHYIWRFKTLERRPVLFAAALGVLLAIRVVHALLQRRGKPARVATPRGGGAAAPG